MSFEFRAAVRGLLLPVAPAREEEFFNAVEIALNAVGVNEDKPAWIAVQLRRWSQDGRPHPAFRALIKRLLFDEARDPPTYIFENLAGPNGESYRNAASGLSRKFFDLHSSLVDQHLLSHDAARQIMSHAGMLIRLAIEERMTASEISRLAAARDNRFALNWRVVRAILQAAGCAPSLQLQRAGQIFDSDNEAEPALLGDLNIIESIERIGEIAESLGCQGDFNGWLTDLFQNDLHQPYLLLLHYQLLVQAEFDHAVTYAYEFSPRGQLGDWLTDCYIEAGVPVAKSAFLNNAKATLRFDSVWVSGRADHLRSATALANILGTLENVGALAKDEIAAQIRGLLHRYMRRQREENDGAIPSLVPHLSDEQLDQLLAGIANANTRTTGILEQRLVDCLGTKRHPDTEGWFERGVGDSVFAANTYRRKFGDAEFVFVERDAPRIVAYESHGGRLTAPYVLDHFDTFRAVLAAREEELHSVAPLEQWTFELVFVAHAFEDGLPLEFDLGEASISVTYLTFENCVNALDLQADRDLLQELMLDKLNDGFVHPIVRQAALGLAGD